MNYKNWKRVCITFLLIPLITMLFTSCITPKESNKNLNLAKVNATDYPDTIGAFFSLGQEYETLFNDGIDKSPLIVINDGEEITDYYLFPQRNQKIPNRTILLVDNSYSMKNENAMGLVKENLKTFIQMMTIKDEVMIIEFNTNIKVLTHNDQNEPVFLSDKTELFSIIDEINYEDKNTILFDSIYSSLEIFPQDNIYQNKNLVVFTDLAETSRYVHNNYNAQQCKELSSVKDIKNYTIVYGNNIDCKFRDKIELLSSSSYYTDKFSEIQSIFNEISNTIYNENLLYGITSYWFLCPTISKDKTSFIQNIVSQYINHCISKDSNGLFIAPDKSIIESQSMATQNLSELFISITNFQNEENNKNEYTEDFFEKAIDSLAETPNDAKNMIFFIEEIDKHLLSLLNQFSNSAVKNGISYNFVILNKDEAVNKKYTPLALKTAGFCSTIPDDLPLEETVNSLVNNLQGDYYLAFSSSPKKTAFNSHRLVLKLANNEQVSDSKTYFVGFINTSFRNSPYFKILIGFLLLLFMILLVGFILLQNNSKKSSLKHTEDFQENIFDVLPEDNDPNENTVLLNDSKQINEENNTVLIRKKPTKGISWITVVKGTSSGNSFTIKETESTKIGRKSSCEAFIQDSTLSEHHATIYKKDKGKISHYYIKDMVSTNHTTVNGKKAEESLELHDNDVIVCGDITFVYKTIAKSQVMK
ncbi:MAG: FHA domain-containing protein [Caldisericia bacterium]|nr:FHA domain-containing protein [Caldisericia bacterium]